VFSARSPRPSPAVVLRRPSLHIKRAECRFRRRPHLSALEPHHLDIGLRPLQLFERGQQVLRVTGSERRGQRTGDDDPATEILRHRLHPFQTFEFFDQCGALDVQQIGREAFVATRPLERPSDQCVFEIADEPVHLDSIVREDDLGGT
jgi:hypothetical protein